MATKTESNLAISMTHLFPNDPPHPSVTSHSKPQHKQSNNLSTFNPMLSVFSKLGKKKLTEQTQLLRDILDKKPEFEGPSDDPTTPVAPPLSPKSTPNLGTLSCSACDVTFVCREEMLEHYRDDWHRYNLRLQLAGKKPVGEQEFSGLLSQEISSISGSDSSDSCSEALPKSPPKIMFYSPEDDSVCSVYRELVHHPARVPSSREELLQLISLIPQRARCAVLMHSAGHFAGAIFHQETVICHKSFHRYVVRAKGGTLQSTHDRIHFARSVGAQMRRANEAALNREIQDLLRSWSDKLSGCDVIFLRIPFYSKQVFYAEGENFGFVKDDPRIRPVPVNTRRPTFTEVKRIHALMTSLLVHCGLDELYSDGDEPVDTEPMLPSSQLASGEMSQEFELEVERNEPEEEMNGKKKTRRPRRAKKNKKSMSSLSDPRIVFFHELMEVCASGETPKTLSLLEEIGDPIDFPVATPPLKEHDTLSLEEILCTPEPAEGTGSEDEWVLVNNPLLDSVIEGSDTIDESPDEAQEIIIELVQTDQPLLNTEVTTPTQEETAPSQPHPVSTSWKELTGEAKRSVLQMKNPDGYTPLHLAAFKGFSPLIFHFLRYGADPTLRDNMGKVPYEKARDKSSRDAFRRFMCAHPNAYDYSKAKITSPLSPEMEEEHQKKRIEKKKNKNSAKKQKKNQTGREKRAIEAEQRFMASKEESGDKMCAQCKDGIKGSNYFEKSSYLYCSMYCLKKHRQPDVL